MNKTIEKKKKINRQLRIFALPRIAAFRALETSSLRSTSKS